MAHSLILGPCLSIMQLVKKVLNTVAENRVLDDSVNANLTLRLENFWLQLNLG